MTTEIYTWSALFDGLTQVDENGTPQPALAETWRLVDKTTWRITLRPNVKFSNGEPFNGEAVRAVHDWLSSDEGKSMTAANTFRYIDSIEVIDDLTIDIKTERPNPIVPAEFQALFIVAPKAWADLGLGGFSQQPSGTGPFRAVSFANERAVLVRNQFAWRQPKVDSLEFIALPEAAARLSAFQAGQIDIMLSVEIDQMKAIEETGGRVDISPAPQVNGIALFFDDAPPSRATTALSDVRVRRALNYAVNRDAMYENLLAGRVGRPAASGQASLAFGFDPDLEPYPYDPQKAKALLAEAGYGDGLKLTFQVLANSSWPGVDAIHQQLAQDLANVGVETKLEVVTFATWLQNFLNNTWQGNGFNTAWDAYPSMDTIAPYQWYSCQKDPPIRCDDAATQLIDQINNEFDVEKRRMLLQKLNRLTYEDAPHIFLFEAANVIGLSSRIDEFKNVGHNRNWHLVSVK